MLTCSEALFLSIISYDINEVLGNIVFDEWLLPGTVKMNVVPRSDAAQRDINLTMCESILFCDDTDNIQRLTLTFVNRHAVCWYYGKLPSGKCKRET